MKYIFLALIVTFIAACANDTFTTCLDSNSKLIKACEYKEKRFAVPTFEAGQ